MDIGKRIKLLRKSLALSQNALAKKAGVPQSVLSEVEAGKYTPKIEFLQNICSALGITLAEFFDDGTKPTPIPDHIKPLLDQARDLTPEQVEQLTRFIKTMKGA